MKGRGLLGRPAAARQPSAWVRCGEGPRISAFRLDKPGHTTRDSPSAGHRGSKAAICAADDPRSRETPSRPPGKTGQTGMKRFPPAGAARPSARMTHDRRPPWQPKAKGAKRAVAMGRKRWRFRVCRSRPNWWRLRERCRLEGGVCAKGADSGWRLRKRRRTAGACRDATVRPDGRSPRCRTDEAPVAGCILDVAEDRWMPVRWPKVPYGHPAQVIARASNPG